MNNRVLLRFEDLHARGIVRNRTQLARMIANLGFPRGFLLSANARVWEEAEIELWLLARRDVA